MSVDTKVRLEGIGVAAGGRCVPGLLIPQLDHRGSTWGYQYRPDRPRPRDGKPVKYETPVGQRNGIDVPPGVGEHLDDPTVALWVTEGVKKADAAVVAGLCCVALPGVWSWRGTNDKGGKVAVADWNDVALNGRRVILAFDSDVVVKPSVRKALDALAAYLSSKGAFVEYLHLPHDDDGKAGLDDYLVAGHTAGDLWKLVRPDAPTVVIEDQDRAPVAPPLASVAPEVAPATLDQVHDVFSRWLGHEYDLMVLDAVLCSAAAEQLDGDPPWLLVVSGSGAAKTETVAALAGAGGHVTSTISSEGALLSATSQRERAKDATGGLLRKIGDSGVLVIKDVTSVLSMSGDARASVLAALREVYDGRWERNVGSDGGRTLTWTGRIVTIGAVTTAWDAAHAVVAAMGDRFLLVRLDSTAGRRASGRQAIANAGSEVQMRTELSTVVAGLLATVNSDLDLTPTDSEADQLLALADVVTLTRTSVTRDYRGDVIDCHAPEMPTRFAKQLTQVLRGGIALGMDRQDALRVAVRCARDSMPPLRLAILADVVTHQASSTHAVRVRLGKPRATVDRELQALHMLGLLDCEEAAQAKGTVWRYTVAASVDTTALSLMGSAKFCSTRTRAHKKGDAMRGAITEVVRVGTAEPGTTPAVCTVCSKRLGPGLVTAGLGAHPSCAKAA